MSVEEAVVKRLRVLSAQQRQEVLDFADSLAAKHAQPQTTQNSDDLLAKADFADYLPQLEAYEAQLARGEIQW